MTNTEVVWLDAYDKDIPGNYIVRSGLDFEEANPFGRDNNSTIGTVAFVPFGVQTRLGQHISTDIPCTAGIMRCNLDGRKLELVA